MYAEYSKIVKFSELADPSDHWDLLDRIGEGTYGEVFMAKHKVRGRCTVHIVAYRPDTTGLSGKLAIGG